MLVQLMTEEEIYGIGHAFGYYDYGEETGMSAAFSGKEDTANYICAYVRGVLQGGFLHTTSEQGGGNITGDLRSKNRHQRCPSQQQKQRDQCVGQHKKHKSPDAHAAFSVFQSNSSNNPIITGMVRMESSVLRT